MMICDTGRNKTEMWNANDSPCFVSKTNHEIKVVFEGETCARLSVSKISPRDFLLDLNKVATGFS